MKNSAQKNQNSFKLQELTKRFENLELYYKKESESIKNEIALLRSQIEIEDEGYTTADDGTDNQETHIIPVATKVPSESEEEDLFQYFDLGSVVQINNSYKGQYGIIGVVYQKSPKFVYFKDSTGKSFHRIPKNLLCLAQNVDEFNQERIRKGKRPIKFKSGQGERRQSKRFW